MKKTYHLPFLLLFALSLSLAACQPSWSIGLSTESTSQGQIDQELVTFYIEKSAEPVETIPLGQIMFANGFTLLDEITLTSAGKTLASFAWDEVGETALIDPNGVISIAGETFIPDAIWVSPSALLEDELYSIMDIAPTVASALGLGKLPDATGLARSISKNNFDQAVMILLDGLNYEKLESVKGQGDLPFLESLDMLQRGVTGYPSITTSATAALLTGAPPQINEVYGYGYRTTEKTTLFDLAVEAGKTVIAVEGASLPFNLRNAETILSGDRDGNGFSDDNVWMNAMEVIQNSLPDLLYIHFHEIDDMGHTHGPDSTEYVNALIRVDQYLSDIYAALPKNTLIVIFADHGMHTTPEGGNHGTLTANDMIIPIIFLEK